MDMALSPDLAIWLRSQGHDAVHASDLALNRAADTQILSTALDGKRVVISADLDFPRLLALAGAAGPGLVLLRSGNYSEAESLECVRRVLMSVADGRSPFELHLPPNVPQELDFAFAFGGRSVAVEIEKANREKILRDILKCHMYLHAGADFALIALPKNYSHTHGVWNLFDFGVQRLSECLAYGFGTPDTFDRILLLGFQQFVASTNAPLSQKTRLDMRDQAGEQLAHSRYLVT